MEKWTVEVGGWTSINVYDCFTTKKEFREMFDCTLLNKQRERFDSISAFPDIYDKVKPEAGLIDLKDIEEAEKNEKQ